MRLIASGLMVTREVGDALWPKTIAHPRLQHHTLSNTANTCSIQNEYSIPITQPTVLKPTVA
jgi:hypothetical protein